MSVFDRLERVASRTVDRINAIPFILTPMRSTPNGRPGPDPDRPVVEGRGVFDYLDGRTGIELGNRSVRNDGNDLRALRSASEPVLSIDRRYVPDIALEPRQGDVVDFPTQLDLPTFTVVSAQRDGLSRLELKLV